MLTENDCAALLTKLSAFASEKRWLIEDANNPEEFHVTVVNNRKGGQGMVCRHENGLQFSVQYGYVNASPEKEMIHISELTEAEHAIEDMLKWLNANSFAGVG